MNVHISIVIILSTTLLFGFLLMCFGADLAPSNEKIKKLASIKPLKGDWPAGCGFSIVTGILSCILSVCYLHSYLHVQHRLSKYYIFGVFLLVLLGVIGLAIWSGVQVWTHYGTWTVTPHMTFCQYTKGTNYCNMVDTNLAFSILLMLAWFTFGALHFFGYTEYQPKDYNSIPREQLDGSAVTPYQIV